MELRFSMELTQSTVWTVRDEDIERQKQARVNEQRRREADLKAQQAAMRKESGMSDDLD